MILVGADVWVKFLILTSVMAICQLIGQISMGNNYSPEWGAYLHLHCVTGINLIVIIWETTLILIAGKCLGGAHLHLHCVTVISSLVSTCNPALLTSHCHLVTCLALPCYHCLWIIHALFVRFRSVRFPDRLFVSRGTWLDSGLWPSWPVRWSHLPRHPSLGRRSQEPRRCPLQQQTVPQPWLETWTQWWWFWWKIQEKQQQQQKHKQRNVPGGCYWTSPASQLARWDVNPGEVAWPGETANLEYDFLISSLTSWLLKFGFGQTWK